MDRLIKVIPAILLSAMLLGCGSHNATGPVDSPPNPKYNATKTLIVDTCRTRPRPQVPIKTMKLDKWK